MRSSIAVRLTTEDLALRGVMILQLRTPIRELLDLRLELIDLPLVLRLDLLELPLRLDGVRGVLLHRVACADDGLAIAGLDATEMVQLLVDLVERIHGTALLTPETPAIALCLPGPSYRVMVSNIKEIKARGAPVIGFGLPGDRELADVVDVFLPVPGEGPWVQVLTSSVLLQLLAYHTARSLETDIDRPRNLAKSVTVE